MHVLGSIGHSFSQRRKSSKCQRSGKPKDLHIHKVSFSGSSLSSECSMSSASTTSTTSTAYGRSPALKTPTSGQAFGPLGLHPTFQPPPRLHERPLISPELASASYPPASAFDDESADEDEDFVCHGIEEEEYTVCSAKAIRFTQATETMLSSYPGSPDSFFADDSELELEPEDYFMMKDMAKRPAMPCSRWSDSTIQTLDLDHLTPDSDDDEGPMTPDSDSHVGLSSPVPNFSYKRDTTAPRRPPMRSLDSLEDFIKQGGWKRRGVIFDAEGGETHSHKSSLF